MRDRDLPDHPVIRAMERTGYPIGKAPMENRFAQEGDYMTEKVVVVTTEDEVSVRDLEVKDGSMLDSLQEIVGGYIEIVRTMGLDGSLVMVVNEDGLNLKLKPNLIGSVLYGTPAHGHPIVGNIVIMGHGYRNGEPDIMGLSTIFAEALASRLKHFVKRFKEEKQ